MEISLLHSESLGLSSAWSFNFLSDIIWICWRSYLYFIIFWFTIILVSVGWRKTRFNFLNSLYLMKNLFLTFNWWLLIDFLRTPKFLASLLKVNWSFASYLALGIVLVQLIFWMMVSIIYEWENAYLNAVKFHKC